MNFSAVKGEAVDLIEVKGTTVNYTVGEKRTVNYIAVKDSSVSYSVCFCQLFAAGQDTVLLCGRWGDLSTLSH